jgi:hypothetical protein
LTNFSENSVPEDWIRFTIEISEIFIIKKSLCLWLSYINNSLYDVCCHGGRDKDIDHRITTAWVNSIWWPVYQLPIKPFGKGPLVAWNVEESSLLFRFQVIKYMYSTGEKNSSILSSATYCTVQLVCDNYSYVI